MDGIFQVCERIPVVAGQAQLSRQCGAESTFELTLFQRPADLRRRKAAEIKASDLDTIEPARLDPGKQIEMPSVEGRRPEQCVDGVFHWRPTLERCVTTFNRIGCGAA